MENLPFKQEIVDDKIVRTFSIDVENEELKWHRDRENRIVEVLEGGFWYLQMDNELPIELVKGKKYYIPEGVYHRVIKGIRDLKVQITKI